MDHEGDHITNVCLLSENDEMVEDEDAKESLLTTMRSASKEKPKMAVIDEANNQVTEIEADFAPTGSKVSNASEDFSPTGSKASNASVKSGADKEGVKTGRSVRQLHHTSTLDLVMQGLCTNDDSNNDESSWPESPVRVRKSEAWEVEKKVEVKESVEEVQLPKTVSDDEHNKVSERPRTETEPITPSKLRREQTLQVGTKDGYLEGDEKKSAPPMAGGDQDSWLDRYRSENRGATPSSQQLIAFVANRGGKLGYKDATALLRERDRSHTLA